MLTRQRPKRLKKVPYRFIRKESDDGQSMYRLLGELVEAYHEDLMDARIALAWQLSWKPDVDGRVTLGKCKRVSDLEREWADVSAHDFVIILQRRFWRDPLVTDLQRRALLDHELTHAAVKYDEKGARVIDEQNRVVYRVRRHDVEDFSSIVERYGCYKNDLLDFAQAIERARAKQDASWVGYRRVQHELQKAGLSVPIETIYEWDDDARREAVTWAVLRTELPTRFRTTLVLPGFLLRATVAADAS